MFGSNVIKGLLLLARGKAAGITEFGNSADALAASLAPLLAFLLVATALAALQGFWRVALLFLLMNLCAVLTISVGTHTGAAWLGRENLWLRTATALNWSIWLLLPLGLLAGIFTGLLTQAGLPFAPAFDAMLCLIGLYFFWYHWFTVRAGLQTSFLRAILIVLGINLIIGLLTVAPDLLDYAFGGHS
jgi:hypothetical protein